MASMTKTEMAQAIVDGAREAGADWEAIASWDLLPGDCAFIRAEYPTDEYPADAVSSEEWRAVMVEVEGLVRETAKNAAAAGL